MARGFSGLGEFYSHLRTSIVILAAVSVVYHATRIWRIVHVTDMDCLFATENTESTEPIILFVFSVAKKEAA